MDASDRIAIVGAGIIGCATAFELARRGARVVVYDSRAPGAGATQASAGILAPYTEAHAGSPLFELTSRGLRCYADFVRSVQTTSGAEIDFTTCGTIEVAADAERTSDLRTRLGTAIAVDAGFEWLDADALRAKEPAVHADLVAGLFCPAHGYVAVRSFTEALVRGAEALGAVFCAGVRVARVVFDDRGATLDIGDRSERAAKVILCAGSWAGMLDPYRELAERVRPVRGQLLVLRGGRVSLRHILWSRDCYIVPWRDKTLLVGATSEEVGFDERATASGVQYLLEAARAVVPRIGSAEFEEVRVGLRPATADGLPIMQPSAREPRLFYATGHFRNGVLLAPLTAHLVADYILDGRLSPLFSAVRANEA